MAMHHDRMMCSGCSGENSAQPHKKEELFGDAFHQGFGEDLAKKKSLSNPQ
jgi:hypothetical protein